MSLRASKINLPAFSIVMVSIVDGNFSFHESTAADGNNARDLLVILSQFVNTFGMTSCNSFTE